MQVVPAEVKDVADWPRLLAGPIVRRVTRDRAHIWICTKMACDAKVVLYDGADVVHNTTSPPLSPSAPFKALDSIGQNLFVGVLAVDLNLGAGGHTLSYDVIIKEGSTERGLFKLGLLGPGSGIDPTDLSPLRTAVPLGYVDGKLPSFVVPVDHHEALRFAHASCRKPHGGEGVEPDAIELVDAQLEATRTTNQAERPQQLILTGDQIYADDVAPGLLALLIEASEKLLGWQEPIPSITTQNDFLIEPGWRTRFLSTVGLKELPPADGTDYSQSHLLRFGEWAAMYVFAWSDALWPVEQTTIPTYSVPDAPATLNETAVDALVRTAEALDVDLVPDGASKVTGVVKKLSEFDNKRVENWRALNPRILGYAGSVRVARRVLANVATYMMFDDHEITDDWYLNGAVHNRLRGIGETGAKKEVGRRMLRNGLSAYAFFQHWGNVPADFENDRQGRQLLDLWRHSGDTCRLKTHPNDADDLLDIGDAVAGIPPAPQTTPPTPASIDTHRAAFQRLRWDYAIDFGAHRLVVLDTRTWRFFPTSAPLTWSSLAPKIPPVKGDAANHGKAELEAIAAAWQTAGATDNTPALQRFADVLNAYKELALVVGGSAATLQAQLQSKFTVLVGEFDDLLDVIPGRPSQPRDPVGSLLHECINNPGAIPSIFSGTITSAREDVLRALREAVNFDFGPESDELTRIFAALVEFVEGALVHSVIGMTSAVLVIARNAGDDVARILGAGNTTAVQQATAAVQVVTGALDQISQQIGIDQLASALLRNGDSRLGAGLIRKQALGFMVTDPLRALGPPKKLTLLLSPAPIFGNRLVELAQRAKVFQLVAQGKAGEEELDFEAWTCNVPAMNDFLLAVKAAALDCAIVLSGDVHYAGSSVNDVHIDSTLTRYLQLTSSSTRNSDGMTRGLSRLDDLLYSDDGYVYFIQTDWPTTVQGGSSALDHLKNLAASKVTDFLDALGDAVDPVALYKDFTYWWDSTPGVLDNMRTTLQRALQSPVGTARAVVNEVAWEVTSTVDLLKDAMNDPLLSVFGDFLTAGQPAREHLRAFYEELGLDPRRALETDQVVIVDRLPDRITPYPVYNDRIRPGTAKFLSENSWQRRTVGHANVGFVKLKTRSTGDVLEVKHELRYYPIDGPKESSPPPVTRTDWMATLHRLGWYGFDPDPARTGAAP
jgi:hypothetical protein